MGIEGRALPRPVGYGTVAALSGRAELNLWALNAMLHRALPVRWALLREAFPRGRRGRWAGLYLHSPARANRMNCRARRCRHPDAIGVILQATFNPVSGWQKRVEALNQVRMASE